MSKWSGKPHGSKFPADECKKSTPKADERHSYEEPGDSYRQIFDAANDAIFVHDIISGKILDVNRKMTEMYGYSHEEAKNLDVGTLSVNEPPYTQPDALQLIRKAAEGEPQLFEWKARDKSGRIFWIEVNLKRAMIGGEYRLLAIVRDITERKETQDKIRESEKKLRMLYESMTDAYASIDLSGNFLEFNDAYKNMLGYSEDELYKLTYSDITPPKWHDMEDRITKEKVLKRGDSDLYEKEYIRKDGTIFPVELRTYLIRDDDGKPIGMWAIVRDITERKRAEVELKDSERRLADIINFLPDATFVIDSEGKIIAWNRATEEMTGVKAADMIGKGDHEYAVAFYGHRRPVLIDMVQKPMEEVQELYECAKLEGNALVAETYTPMLKPGGAYLWFRATPLYGTDGKVIGAIESIRDVTDRKLAEEYKMEFYRRTIIAATNGKLVMAEKHDIYKIAGPSIAEYDIINVEDIGKIRTAVSEIAAQVGMDDSLTHDFVVTIGEASTNALKHAGGGRASVHKTQDSLMFVVSDCGPGIEAMTIPQVAFVKGYTTAGTLGMGYKIIIALAETVYIATSSVGTTVGIKMKLHRQTGAEAEEGFDWAHIKI